MTGLETKFIEFIKTFTYDPRKGNNSSFYHNGRYNYKEDPYFDDVNKEVDRKNKRFGIRCDDSFYQIAYLPYEYRFLSMEFIASVLWEGRELKICPDFPSIERKKWEAVREVDRHEAEGYKFLDRKPIRDGIKRKPYAKSIHNKYVRYELLKRLDRDSPIYKDIYNFKQKKRKGYISSSNKWHSTSFLVSGVHTGTLTKLSKKDYEDIKKQSAIIYESHKKSKFADRHRPLTEVELRIARDKGDFPVYVKEENREISEYLYGKENVIVDDVKAEEQFRKRFPNLKED